jgi:hypothetical protein
VVQENPVENNEKQIAIASDLSQKLAQNDLRSKAVSTLEHCLGTESTYYDGVEKKIVTGPAWKTCGSKFRVLQN